MAKETKSIYYHYTSQKKKLSDKDKQLIKPLEEPLRQHGQLKPQFGSCYYCHSTSHWVNDCSFKKRQLNGECFSCGSLDHWAKDCTKKDDKPLDIPPSPRRATEKPSTPDVDPMKKSDSGKKTNKKYPFEETSDASPSKERKTEKTTELRVTRKKTAMKQHCFICKSESHSAKDCGDAVVDSNEELKS